jgi:hypothetical protein
MAPALPLIHLLLLIVALTDAAPVLLHVDSKLGNDATGLGSAEHPFQSVVAAR